MLINNDLLETLIEATAVSRLVDTFENKPMAIQASNSIVLLSVRCWSARHKVFLLFYQHRFKCDELQVRLSSSMHYLLEQFCSGHLFIAIYNRT